MMKGKLLFGVCLSTLILLMAPSISAQQYYQVKKDVELQLEEQLNQIIFLLIMRKKIQS